MTTYAFETPMGIDVSQLLISQYPRAATLTYSYDRARYAIEFANPAPLSALVDTLEECYQIRVVDRNTAGMQLEFGRFNVEIWDEDNRMTEFTVDRYAQLELDNA